MDEAECVEHADALLELLDSTLEMEPALVAVLLVTAVVLFATLLLLLPDV